MTRWLAPLLLASLITCLTPPAATADASKDEDQKALEKAYAAAIDKMARKNIFDPYTPPPQPKPKQPEKKPEPEAPKVEREVREDLVVTGFLWDNSAQAFIALVQTRDNSKRLQLAEGDKVGDYTVKAVLDDTIGLIDSKGEATEVGLGEAFKGGVIGKEMVTGTSSGSRGRRSRPGKKPAKPLPKLSTDKKMSIIEKLRARRKAQMEKAKEGKK